MSVWVKEVNGGGYGVANSSGGETLSNLGSSSSSLSFSCLPRACSVALHGCFTIPLGANGPLDTLRDTVLHDRTSLFLNINKIP